MSARPEILRFALAPPAIARQAEAADSTPDSSRAVLQFPGETTRRQRRFGMILVVLALSSIGFTFLVLLNLTPIEPSQGLINMTMLANGVCVGLLCLAIGAEVAALIGARRMGRAAARLHVKIVTQFSIIAAIPAILVAIIATVTLDRGLDRWFQQRSIAIVDNALIVAQAYLQEHGRTVLADLIDMARELERSAEIYEFDPARFDSIFQIRARLRGLDGAFLMRSDGTIDVRLVVQNNDEIQFPPLAAYRDAAGGDPVLISPGGAGLVGGVMQLEAYDDLYIYVARAVDRTVIDHLQLAEEGAAQYQEMRDSRLGVQIAFALVYISVTLVLLLVAIWIGFGFANRLVAPIGDLITASGNISKGNFDVNVAVHKASGDLALLAETFNKMTRQLKAQRGALLEANAQIDRRRQLTEAILAGARAGVIGIDEYGRTVFANQSALDIVNLEAGALLNHRLAEKIPDLATFLQQAQRSAQPKLHKFQWKMMNEAGEERIVNIRISSEQNADAARQFVITLDDITDLLTAQRLSAWGDIARRIAHEIKNPLTPIQLAAERIKRKYRRHIDSDTRIFDQCIDTITRQVGDIRCMVDEFSNFARMPKAVLRCCDLRETVRQAVFAQGVANPDIVITADLPDAPVIHPIDDRLLSQALTNLTKNACEAIIARGERMEGAARPARGRVTLRLVPGHSMREDSVGEDSMRGKSQEHTRPHRIEISDNGTGFPPGARERFLEPYVTARDKGTGLGLAIVRKIMKEHGGSIELRDACHDNGEAGALIRLVFPVTTARLELLENARLQGASAAL